MCNPYIEEIFTLTLRVHPWYSGHNVDVDIVRKWMMHGRYSAHYVDVVQKWMMHDRYSTHVVDVDVVREWMMHDRYSSHVVDVDVVRKWMMHRTQGVDGICYTRVNCNRFTYSHDQMRFYTNYFDHALIYQHVRSFRHAQLLKNSAKYVYSLWESCLHV